MKILANFKIDMKKPEQERIRQLKSLLLEYKQIDIGLLRDPRYYVVPEKERNELIKQA